jgi:outer membrane protein assembly factor BamB
MRAAVTISIMGFVSAFAGGAALGQSTLVLTPTSGHPNASIGFKGASFGGSEAVDIYVDTVDTLLLVSSATGTLTGSVSLTKTTQPGPHYITAIGRRSGDAAQAAFTVTTPWDEFGFGAAHMGWNSWENTLDINSVGSLGPLYGVATGAIYSSPSVANGHLYVSSQSGNGLEALSTTSGAVLWKAETAARFAASPALSGNALYIGSAEDTMYAVNANSGAQIWATAGGGSFSSPVVSGGSVFTGCFDGKLYAFQAATTAHTAGGTILWTYATGGIVNSSPAIFNNVIYFGSADRNVYAVTTAGALLWSYTTGAVVFDSPAVGAGLVFVGSYDDNLYALKADTGALAWSATTNGAIRSSPAFAYGLVYVGSDDGNLYAFNAHTGALQWSVNVGSAFGFGSPVVADGVVYAAPSEGTLYAIQATTGAVLWTFTTDSGGFTNPAVSDGQVYFNSGDGETYAFATQAGTAAAKARAHAPAVSTLHPDMRLVASR